MVTKIQEVILARFQHHRFHVWTKEGGTVAYCVNARKAGKVLKHLPNGGNLYIIREEGKYEASPE